MSAGESSLRALLIKAGMPVLFAIRCQKRQERRAILLALLCHFLERVLVYDGNWENPVRRANLQRLQAFFQNHQHEYLSPSETIGSFSEFGREVLVELPKCLAWYRQWPPFEQEICDEVFAKFFQSSLWRLDVEEDTQLFPIEGHLEFEWYASYRCVYLGTLLMRLLHIPTQFELLWSRYERGIGKLLSLQDSLENNKGKSYLPRKELQKFNLANASLHLSDRSNKQLYLKSFQKQVREDLAVGENLRKIIPSFRERVSFVMTLRMANDFCDSLTVNPLPQWKLSVMKDVFPSVFHSVCFKKDFQV